MADDQITSLTLPVLPLTSSVVVPQMMVTLALATDEAKAAGEAASAGSQLLLLPRDDDGRYAKVGVIAVVDDIGSLPDGTPAVVVQATGRALVGAGVVGETAALWVHVDPVVEPPPSDRAKELAAELRATVAALFEGAGGRRPDILRGVEDPGALADLAGWWPELSLERKVELLEAVDVEDRVGKVLSWAKEALAERELTQKIRKDVSEGLEKNQREFILRQQMASIRKELGDDGDEEDLVETYRLRLDELRDGGAVTDATAKAIEREIGRLDRTPAQNMEHGWIRTWLDTVFELPWGRRTQDHLDVADARAILDADHTGLDEVKERIVEFLAVRKLPRRARHRRHRRHTSEGRRDHRPRRSARRGQDVPRRIGRTARSAASSSASRSAASATSRRSAVIAAPMSARRRVASSTRYAKPRP